MNRLNNHARGKLEVICGPMFSGKSEELMRRLRRAIIAKQTIVSCKHAVDTRFMEHHVVSHSGTTMSAFATSNPATILEYAEQCNADVVGIDEVQFFDEQIIVAINTLLEQGRRVIVAGLDLDFRGLPFGPMPTLLALAYDVIKLKAICTLCGNDAAFSQRLVNGKPAHYADPTILVGAQESYQARCHTCYTIEIDPTTHKRP